MYDEYLHILEDKPGVFPVNALKILYKKNNIEINKINKIKEWFNIDINKILFITGPMCSGKSKLTAELIDLYIEDKKIKTK